MKARLINWVKLPKLVMNYKFSDRELLLLKLLAGIAIVISLFYVTSYLSNEITRSKESLFFEVNNFNEKKQLLSVVTVFCLFEIILGYCTLREASTEPSLAARASSVAEEY